MIIDFSPSLFQLEYVKNFHTAFTLPGDKILKTYLESSQLLYYKYNKF